jgi:hypothetical protein
MVAKPVASMLAELRVTESRCRPAHLEREPVQRMRDLGRPQTREPPEVGAFGTVATRSRIARLTRTEMSRLRRGADAAAGCNAEEAVVFRFERNARRVGDRVFMHDAEIDIGDRW